MNRTRDVRESYLDVMTFIHPSTSSPKKSHFPLKSPPNTHRWRSPSSKILWMYQIRQPSSRRRLVHHQGEVKSKSSRSQVETARINDVQRYRWLLSRRLFWNNSPCKHITRGLVKEKRGKDFFMNFLHAGFTYGRESL